jgi:hypothetical protein
MGEILITLFSLLEVMFYLSGLAVWTFQNNTLLGIMLVCMAIFMNLCKNDTKRRLEKEE